MNIVCICVGVYPNQKTPNLQIKRLLESNLAFIYIHCEESISGTGLYNTSLYMACIWLKATGQEAIALNAEDSIASLIIDRWSAKQSLSFAAALLRLINIA